MKTSKVTRREFIVKAGQTALAAAVVAPMMGFDAKASSGKAPLPLEPITLDLAKPDYAALATIGGALKIPNPRDKGKPIIVCRTSETAVAAFSSKCTHMGCEVPVPANGVITCQCHQSQFDATGKVTKGPANKNLAAFSATLEGNVITIKELQS
jgi:Rieske Fe-S protein